MRWPLVPPRSPRLRRRLLLLALVGAALANLLAEQGAA